VKIAGLGTGRRRNCLGLSLLASNDLLKKFSLAAGTGRRRRPSMLSLAVWRRAWTRTLLALVGEFARAFRWLCLAVSARAWGSALVVGEGGGPLGGVGAVVTRRRAGGRRGPATGRRACRWGWRWWRRRCSAFALGLGDGALRRSCRRSGRWGLRAAWVPWGCRPSSRGC